MYALHIIYRLCVPQLSYLACCHTIWTGVLSSVSCFPSMVPMSGRAAMCATCAHCGTTECLVDEHVATQNAEQPCMPHKISQSSSQDTITVHAHQLSRITANWIHANKQATTHTHAQTSLSNRLIHGSYYGTLRLSSSSAS